MNLHTLASTALVTTFTAITLLAPTRSYAQPTFLEPIPAGCTVTRSWEDGSAIATCSDGSLISYDADGLGPYCPKTSKRFGPYGWHTEHETQAAHNACKAESKKLRNK